MSDDLRALPITDLAAHLRAARQTSYTLLDCFGAALDSERLAVPFQENLNPPLWEFGHVAWFTDYWIARNPQRSKGKKYAAIPHLPSALAPADGLFNSATVAHETRWQLPLLGITGIHQYLQEVADRTEECLTADMAAWKAAGTKNDVNSVDDTSYFYRLALAHEDMHAEAFYMTAQDLAFPFPGTARPPWRDASESVQKADRALAMQAGKQRPQILIPAQSFSLAPPSRAFYFDNEADALSEALGDFSIDALPVNHGQFAEFIQDKGYQRSELWTPEGWAWRSSVEAHGPRHLSIQDGRLYRQWFGETHAVPEWCPMIQVSLYEAQAWAQWAGRRLPTEAEWVATAQAAPDDFLWGSVWEWTATKFLPFDGFQEHPYKEYSVPWFGDHQVLKGASWVTNQRLRNLRFRNFYRPHRADVFAGFRTVSNQL
ncbi:MAG: ergothioneine biosynthesis protein EgtB [Pseudomonadota bacterium]